MVKDFAQKGGYFSASPFVGIQDLFSDGMWINSTLSTVDNRDLKLDFEHLLYGLLAEKAWRLTPDIYPTVVYGFRILILSLRNTTDLKSHYYSILNQPCDSGLDYMHLFVPKARSCAVDGVTIYVYGIFPFPFASSLVAMIFLAYAKFQEPGT